MPGRIQASRTLATGLAVAALLTASAAHADDRVIRIPAVEMEIRALAGSDQERHPLTLKADRPAELEFKSEWDPLGDVRVELEARAEPAGDGDARRVRLRAELVLPGGRRIQASREAVVKDRTTILFELYRHDDRPFTLAITAEISQGWEVSQTVSVGPPVRFEVEVVHVRGTTQTSLERNLLHTFVNQSVRYEYRAGSELSDEALTLSLTPVRLVGDLIEIKVNIEGRLPTEDGVTVVAREDNVVVNRGATSPVDAVTGDPPMGYRFRVRALF